jgi:hypothetical protein
MYTILSGVKQDDEALRRVLGLVRWDAAAELKEKIGLAGSEMAQQLRKVRPACVCMARMPTAVARAHLGPVHFTLPPPLAAWRDARKRSE